MIYSYVTSLNCILYWYVFVSKYLSNLMYKQTFHLTINTKATTCQLSCMLYCTTYIPVCNFFKHILPTTSILFQTFHLLFNLTAVEWFTKRYMFIFATFVPTSWYAATVTAVAAAVHDQRVMWCDAPRSLRHARGNSAQRTSRLVSAHSECGCCVG